MGRWTFSVLVALASAAGVAAAKPVSAEWFIDAYAGRAFTQREDVRIDTPSSNVRITLRDVDFDQSLIVGARIGYWFESAPFFGIGLDAFHLKPKISDQVRSAKICLASACSPGTQQFADFDLEMIGASLDVMLRAADLSAEREVRKPVVHPYLTVGPLLAGIRAKDSTNFADPSGQSDEDLALGFKAGAGFVWEMFKHLAVFGEYRFTHISPKFGFKQFGVRNTVETELNTHQVVGGISVRF